MRTNRFYIEQQLAAGPFAVTDKRLVHQIKNVLRMQAGSPISLFNGNGSEWHATIREIDHDECALLLQEEQRPDIEAKRTVHAGISLLKKDNFEFAAQKLVEVGIASITPIIADRTVKTGIDKNRLQKIMIEAAEQSGRLIIPLLTEPMAVSAFIEQHNSIVVFDAGNKEKSVKEDKDEISFLIGPEGGWSETEIALFEEKNLPLLSLGKTILRAETAAIIGGHSLVWK